jgi:hypothetical protein
MPDCPVLTQLTNRTSSTPPDISLPMVNPPLQPEYALRTVMFFEGMPYWIPAQFHPDFIATASSPAQ